MATPAAPVHPPAVHPDAAPRMCLLHADFHPMGSACWETTLDWYFTHGDLSESTARAQYLAEVEQVMLNQHIRAHQADGVCGGDR